MIQNALEENNMDKAIVYKWLEGKTFIGECWQKKSTKTPRTVDTMEIFSILIRKDFYLMIFDEFEICYGAANKVVK